MSAQEDGYYPRLNASLLATGNFNQMIVSVVGTVEACDGQFATVKCCDGGQARLIVDPSFAHPAGTMLEMIGAATETNEVQVGAYLPCVLRGNAGEGRGGAVKLGSTS